LFDQLCKDLDHNLFSSLHRNENAFNESSSSDMPVCEEVAGERSIIMAEQELKRCPTNI
jgi:hypothetical protein